MENKITRRGFIGSIAAFGALPLIGKGKDWFEDIRVDRYYVLQGGQYGDTGGYGQPGYMQGPEFLNAMRYWEYCRELEDKLDIVEKRGFYLTPSSYLEDPWREYDKIYLTKRWMLDFYNRHKDEPVENWKKRYGKCLDRYLESKREKNGISYEH